MADVIKPKQTEVVCPHCKARQNEPEGAFSTNCRACGRYFKIGIARGPRVSRALKADREIFCIKCGAPNLVSSAAMSTQCARCLHYLELGDKVVRGAQTGKLYAYDDVVFAEGCSFKGMEATGRRIEVRGHVFSKLRASAEIVIFEGAQLSGEVNAPVVRIERGVKVRLQTLECARLMVSSELEVSGTLTASEIIFGDGAVYSGRLQMPETKLKIEFGAQTKVDSITCSELIVEGTVTLAGPLIAETITVTSSGHVTSPRISASRIEVSLGGGLQGRIEKYVPRVTPAETSPPEGETKPKA